MSRAYLNGRWCVRCGRTEATPYLRAHWRKLQVCDDPDDEVVLDLGCGNMRNTRFMRERGFRVVPVDMCAEGAEKCVLGVDALPVPDRSVTIILANYVFMFLNRRELRFLLDEILRVAAPHCRIMVELYPAKDSNAPDADAVKALKNTLLDCLYRPRLLLSSKDRFIGELVCI